MSKNILVTALILLFLVLFLPNPILADQYCKLPDCTATITPPADAIFQNTPKITIEVKNNQNNFTAKDYTFSAWNVTRGESYCPINQYINVTSSQITASWDLVGCRGEIGQYKFQLWSGRGTSDRNSNSLIAEYDFTIQQTSGGIPTLTPLQQTVQLGTKPTVLLSNPRSGNSYVFWWDPSQFSLAAKKTNISNADLKNGILFVELDLTGNDFKAGVPRKLCMEIGNYISPAGLTCRFSTFFTFSNKPPSVTGVQCSILPSNTPTINDDVSLLITNAVPGTSYEGHLDKDGVLHSRISTQSVDATKTLVLPLGQKLPLGTYLPYIYDISNKGQILNSCSIGFSVGNIDTSANLKDICKESPDKCTKGGGDPCGDTQDNRGPAFKTAIGCVHTNPAEFVKDLMTWVIGIGGGIAFLMMLLGAFQMLTSAGNPETLNAGKDRLTSAVIGLLFVIFAILLLQIIGVGILNIPGFGK